MFGANRAPILYWNKHCLQIEWNVFPPDPRHIVVPSDVSNMIFEPLVHSVQTMHLFFIKITTISKRTKTSFHLSLMIMEYHRVRPKRFRGQWYVWRKPNTYLALTLTLSPNGPKQDSTWPTSPRSSIGCIKNDFWAYGTLNASRAPILRQIGTISKWTESSFHLSIVT
jgi:hypothetical protein